MNVEVTVTGQRGWVDETTRELAADMTVEGKIWFGPSMHRSSLGAELLALCTDLPHPFPSNKANAIIVTTHAHEHPEQPIFPVLTEGNHALYKSRLCQASATSMGSWEYRSGDRSNSKDRNFRRR